MMVWYGNGMGGWGYAMMTVSTVLFWIVIGYLAVVLVRHLRRSPEGTTGRTDPENILAERFARGEIDEQEYEARLSTLRSISGDRSPG
jgi:putative membrane protein